MDDQLRRYHRVSTVAAILALPHDPSPEAVDEAVDAIRNVLTTGHPGHDANGTEQGRIYEHLEGL